MAITLNGTTGITTDTGYSGDGISFADGTPSNTLVTTTGGNVGIGTSSPSSKLHVAGTGTQGITVERTDASTAGLFQLLSGNSTNVINASTAKPISFEINAAERMRIDSSGRVTTPYQPAFSVVGAGSGSLTAGTVIQFQAGGSAQINFDVGSTWNSSTDRFTAPISGKYYFSFAIYVQNCNAAAQSIAPCVNGGQISTISDTFMFFGGIISSSDNMVTSAFILNLAAGDYVDLRVRLGSNTITYYAHHSWFQGFLIG